MTQNKHWEVELSQIIFLESVRGPSQIKVHWHGSDKNIIMDLAWLCPLKINIFLVDLQHHSRDFFSSYFVFGVRRKDPVKHSKSVVWKGVFRLIWTDRILSFYQTQSKYWNPKIALAPHVNPSNKTIMRKKMRKSEQSSRVTQEKDHLPIACQHCINTKGRVGEERGGLEWEVVGFCIRGRPSDHLHHSRPGEASCMRRNEIKIFRTNTIIWF